MGQTVTTEKPSLSINDHVRISDDEYVIKDYRAAKVKKPTKGEAHVALTNKRAIIYYWTERGVLVNDAHITEVLSTDVFWAKRQRRKLGTIFLILGVFTLTYSLFVESSFNSIPGYMPGSLLLGVLFAAIPLIAAGLYYLFKMRYTFVFVIYIRAVTGALSFFNIPAGRMERALRPEKMELEGKPGEDAEIMAKEIGAMILDIQKGVGS